MLLPQLTLLLCLIIISECQVKFPSSTPRTTTTPSPDIPETCMASNGIAGVCYESRSSAIDECSFFPSTDLNDPDVAKHLTANICKNTGYKLYFCCPTKISVTLPKEDECKPSVSDNIVGGEITVEGDWPWLAAIGMVNGSGFNQFCGGSLITKQHVITAAHCFNTRFEKTIVRIGEYDLNDDFDGALEFTIAGERIHNYSRFTSENDIIVLKLDKPVPTFTDNLRPACLPYHLRNYDFTGRNLTVVGWGVFRQTISNGRLYGDQSPIPLKAQIPAVSSQDCQEIYKNNRRKVDDRQLCAGIGGGVDSCNGDSGGPIHYLDLETNYLYVVGLVSFGPGICGNSTNPGVYTRIGAFLDWIEESVRQLQ